VPYDAPALASIMNHDLPVYLDALVQQVLLLDEDGRIMVANRAWREYARLRSGEEQPQVGQCYFDTFIASAMVDGGMRSDLSERIRQVLTGASRKFTTELASELNGRRHWYMLHAEAMAGGGAVVSHYDVTEIRSLDEARTRFASLANDSNEYVLLIDDAGTVVYANLAARRLAQRLHADGAAHLTEPTLARWSSLLARTGTLRQAQRVGVWRGELVLPAGEGDPVIVSAVVHAQPEENGSLVYYSVVLHDVTGERQREAELHDRHVELELAYSRLKDAQQQLLQSEKMASIGQLAAGVAHEINNPIGYVHSNLGTLQDYMRALLSLIEGYERLTASQPGSAAERRELEDLRERLDVDFIVRDLPSLLSESREGIERVKKIVQDLKDFSHAGQSDEWVWADLHSGLDSTLNIVWNELKYKAEVHKSYGKLPLIECLPSQLNQVFMNILVNAAQAIERQGTINVSTGVDGGEVWIAIADNGSGMPESVIQRIFDPFFTTKAVGQGTGLGLSLSYGIVKKHHGRIDVRSEPDLGTEFRIVLPIAQAHASDTAPSDPATQE